MISAEEFLTEKRSVGAAVLSHPQKTVLLRRTKAEYSAHTGSMRTEFLLELS